MGQKFQIRASLDNFNFLDFFTSFAPCCRTVSVPTCSLKQKICEVAKQSVAALTATALMAGVSYLSCLLIGGSLDWTPLVVSCLKSHTAFVVGQSGLCQMQKKLSICV